MISAKVIAASVNPNGIKLYTLELKYNRTIHAEVNTYRMFCLAGAVQIQFDPSDRFDHWLKEAVGGREHMTIEAMHHIEHGGIPPHSAYASYNSVDDLLQPDKLAASFNKTHYYTFSSIKDFFGDKVHDDDLMSGLSEHIRYMPGDVNPVVYGEYIFAWYAAYYANRCKDRMQKASGVKSAMYKIPLLAYTPNTGAREESRVKEISFMGHQLVFEVEVETYWGVPLTIEATPNHRFYTDQGATPLSNLQEGEYVYVVDPKTQEIVPAKIASITKKGVKPTYDIEVTGESASLVANGFLVHNSRNAASSRAINMTQMREDILRNPAMPVYWGQNQKGMSAASELPEESQRQCEAIWRESLEYMACQHARLEQLGLAKQTTNRLLETWAHITVILTSNEEGLRHMLYERLHESAQPEFRVLAQEIEKAIEGTICTPLKVGEWHLPYYSPEHDYPRIYAYIVDNQIPFREFGLMPAKLSAARCAGVSYMRQEVPRPIEQELDLYAKLVVRDDFDFHGDPITPTHMSPGEHPCRCEDDEVSRGNIKGFTQLRKLLPYENLTKMPK